MFKIRRFVAGILVALLVAAGCSSDSADEEVVDPASGTDETPEVDEPSSTESSAPEEAPTDDEDTPESDPPDEPEPRTRAGTRTRT